MPRPTQARFGNYQALFTSDQYPYRRWIKNSLILATVNSACRLLMGACAAYAFSRMRFAAQRRHARPDARPDVPGVLAITAVYYLLNSIPDFPTFGLRSISGTLLVYLGGALGVNTFLMKGYFDTIPNDMDESARIDGAGHFRVFAGLIMRLSLPIRRGVLRQLQLHVQRAADRPGRDADQQNTTAASA